MSILIKPTMRCQSNCVYCYEDSLRKEGKFMDYDLDKVLKAMEAAHKRFGDTDICFHGGEILTLPKTDLEKLFKKAFELNKRTSIQTNGLLVDEDIIKMFKKYKTSVGLSMDGPDELNLGRWRTKNRERTDKVIKTIYKMKIEKISVGLITVITRFNCLPAQRKKFKDFILEMKSIKCPSGRMNPVIAQADYVPTIDEYKEFYLDMCDFILSDPRLQWQPFRDIIDNLMGYAQSTCIYHQCDFFWTNSAHVILGDGLVRNCMKTVLVFNVFQGKEASKVRYDALFHTPREHGGCKGCRYWSICSGLCPSEGIDGDWRNRSYVCEVYYALYERIEKKIRALFPRIKLITDYEPKGPSDSVSSREFCRQVEKLNFSTWRQTQRVQKPRKAEEGHQDSTGITPDHKDVAHGDHDVHGDSSAAGHQDQKHGDSTKHGDSDAPDQRGRHGDSSGAGHQDQEHGDYSRHADQ